MIDVVINVLSKIESEQTEQIELDTVGQMEINDGTITLYYEQTDGQDKCDTVISIVGDTVTIVRTGSTATTMTIHEGERCQSVYDVGFGQFEIGIYGKHVESSLSASGGKLSLEYLLDINAESVSNNIIEVNVRRL